MIKQVKVYVVECDKWGKRHSIDPFTYEYDIFESREEAMESMDLDESWKRVGDKFYCFDCAVKYGKILL